MVRFRRPLKEGLKPSVKGVSAHGPFVGPAPSWVSVCSRCCSSKRSAYGLCHAYNSAIYTTAAVGNREHIYCMLTGMYSRVVLVSPPCGIQDNLPGVCCNPESLFEKAFIIR